MSAVTGSVGTPIEQFLVETNKPAVVVQPQEPVIQNQAENSGGVLAPEIVQVTAIQQKISKLMKFSDNISNANFFTANTSVLLVPGKPDDKRAFAEMVRELSNYLSTNPKVLPKIEVVVNEFRDEEQLLKKIWEYELLLENLVLESEAKKCDYINPRVRECFVFLKGNGSLTDEEVLVQFDSMYAAAVRDLDPDGSIAERLQLAQKKYLNVRERAVEWKVSYDASEWDEHRLSFRSFCPVVDLVDLHKTYPELFSDSNIVGYGSFNNNEGVDREIDTMKMQLNAGGLPKEQIEAAVAQKRTELMAEVAAMYNAANDSFVYEAYLAGNDRNNRGGPRSHPGLFNAPNPSKLQTYFIGQAVASALPTLMKWIEDVKKFPYGQDFLEEYFSSLPANLDVPYIKEFRKKEGVLWDMAANQEQQLKRFREKYCEAHQIAPVADGEFATDRLDKKIKQIHDVVINELKQMTFSAISTMAITQTPEVLVKSECLFQGTIDFVHAGGRTNTQFKEGQGNVWFLKVPDPRGAECAVNNLSVRMEQSFLAWGPKTVRVEAADEKDEKEEDIEEVNV